MHSMGKHYDAATKERAVRMVQQAAGETGSVVRACERVGASLGISKDTVRGWARQAQINDGATAGMTTAEREEIRDLKAKVRRLEDENSILRSAATYAGDRCQAGVSSRRLSSAS
jgi:transposase